MMSGTDSPDSPTPQTHALSQDKESNKAILFDSEPSTKLLSSSTCKSDAMKSPSSTRPATSSTVQFPVIRNNTTATDTNKRFPARYVTFCIVLLTVLILILTFVLIWTVSLPRLVQQQIPSSVSIKPADTSVPDPGRKQSTLQPNINDVSQPFVVLVNSDDASAAGATDASAPFIASQPLNPHSLNYFYSSHQQALNENRARFPSISVEQQHQQDSLHDHHPRGMNRQSKSSEKHMVQPDYLFLRSKPRWRHDHHAAIMDSQHQKKVFNVPIHSTGFIELNFAAIHCEANSSLNASSSVPHHHHEKHAQPYLINCHTPLMPSSQERISNAISSHEGGYYHIERYIPVGNYLIVPSDATSSEIRMQQALLNLKPLVEKWHMYETQDKIEPELYENCNDMHNLIAEFITADDSPTYDLRVSLFHSAMTGSHLHRITHSAQHASVSSSQADEISRNARAQAHAHTMKMRSLHGVIPRASKRVVSSWKQELHNSQYSHLFQNITFQLEAAQLVLVKIPIPLFYPLLHRHNVSHSSTLLNSSGSTPAATDAELFPFCEFLSILAWNPHVEYIEHTAAFETHNKYASSLIQSGTYPTWSAPSPSSSTSVTDSTINNSGSELSASAALPPLTGRSLYERGLTGMGQIVTVADTGVAHGHCLFNDASAPTPIDTVNFAHRKIVSYVNTRGKEYDLPNGHGSHTAASIAGSISHAELEAASTLQSLDSTTSDRLSALQRIGQYSGVAPDAKLAIFDVNDGMSAGKIKPPKDIYAKYFQLAYETMGARISSNSWGSKNGTYIIECREIDRFVMDHPDFLPIFSSGNYGDRGVQSVVAPGTAKNCLTVGAIGNIKVKEGVNTAYYCANPAVPPFGTESPSSPGWGQTLPQSVANADSAYVEPNIHLSRLYSYVSGAGPTYDERFKPEVMAPGHYITSARSSGDVKLDRCLECDASLMSLFGTSMSAAIAAGSAALVRQYFTDGFYPTGQREIANRFLPSGALVKAVMIASAVPDTVETAVVNDVKMAQHFFEELASFPMQTGPTPKSGFGRIQLDSVLKFAAPIKQSSNTNEADYQYSSSATTSEMETSDEVQRDLWVLDQKRIEALDFQGYCFRVRSIPSSTAQQSASNSTSAVLLPFRVTLVWSDPPASLSASWLLINNLDLSISNTHTGAVWVGNQHWNDPHPSYDSTNNVEQIHIPAHLLHAGETYSVHVRGTNIPHSPQPYALVVSGSFDALPVSECASERGAICPNLCSNRGRCSESSGVCECQQGYAGIGCEQTSISLQTAFESCAIFTGQVALGKWAYYHFDVTPPSAGTTVFGADGSTINVPPSLAAPLPPSLRVLLTSLSGSPDLYLSLGRMPTLQDHDYAHLIANTDVTLPTHAETLNQGNKQFISQVDVPLALPGRYYIGVFGYCCEEISKFQVQMRTCANSTATIQNRANSNKTNDKVDIPTLP